MKDFNYKLQIYPDLNYANRNKSISMLFTSIEELNAAETMAANLLLFLQDDIKVMRDSSNVFLCEELIDGEWEEIEL